MAFLEDDLKVNINEYLPLRDVVFNTLRQAILKGELEPGERLMEIQLAKRLGVSRTPIREAIRKLELEGLVVMVPRKGAEVAKITQKDLSDVLEVRKALEVLAVQIACERMTKEQLGELKSVLEEFKESIKTKEPTIIAEIDMKFHDVIFMSTDNHRLIQILNNLREQMYRYRMEYIKDEKKHSVLIKEHEEIIKSIEEKDKERAAKAITGHIDNQEVTIINAINANE